MQAKKNIEYWFPTIGVLELLAETFLVMERTVPEYFSGIANMYRELQGYIP